MPAPQSRAPSERPDNRRRIINPTGAGPERQQEAQEIHQPNPERQLRSAQGKPELDALQQAVEQWTLNYAGIPGTTVVTDAQADTASPWGIGTEGDLKSWVNEDSHLVYSMLEQLRSSHDDMSKAVNLALILRDKMQQLVNDSLTKSTIINNVQEAEVKWKKYQ